MTTNSNRMPRLLSVAEVAQHLDVCAETVRRPIKAGALPTHRLGHQIRIAETDLGIDPAQTKQGVQWVPVMIRDSALNWMIGKHHLSNEFAFTVDQLTIVPYLPPQTERFHQCPNFRT